MNKTEFLKQMKAFLGILPEADQNEILYDYEEHFSIGLSNGKTEEEIANALGAPSAIVKQYLSDINEHMNQNEKLYEKILSKKLTKLKNSFTQDGNVAHLIDQELKLSVSDLAHLKVKGINENINIHLIQGTEARIHLYGMMVCFNPTDFPELALTTKSNTALFEVKYNNRNNSVIKYDLKLDVYLPIQYHNDFTAYSVSGSIIYERLLLNIVDFTTVSGAILGTYLRGNRINLKSTSGNIQTGLEGKSVKINSVSGCGDFSSLKADQLQINIVSGTYKMMELNTIHFIFEGVSGNLITSNTTIEHVEVSTVSGNMHLDGKIEGGAVTATSGTIRVALSALEKDLELKTCSGNINLELDHGIETKIFAQTSFGSVKVDGFENIVYSQREKNKMSASIGNGDKKIKLEAEFGAIKIQSKKY